MYEYHLIPYLIQSTEAAITKQIERHGIGIYVDCNPDDVSPDIYIDPADTEGIAIVRRCLAEILAHYKSLGQ